MLGVFCKPLWHRDVLVLDLGAWVTGTSCSLCAVWPRSRSPSCFCFLSTSQSLQIDSSPVQSAGEFARSSCSSWRFQIFIFSKDGFFSPSPLAGSFALPCTRIACHKYSVFVLNYLLFTSVTVYRETTTTQTHPKVVYMMAAIWFIYLCGFDHFLLQSLIKCCGFECTQQQMAPAGSPLLLGWLPGITAAEPWACQLRSSSVTSRRNFSNQKFGYLISKGEKNYCSLLHFTAKF